MEQTAIAIPLDPATTRHLKFADIKSLPRPRYKGHWALITNDVDATHAFYQALTGTVLMSRPQPTSIASSWDHEHHRFFLGPLQGFPGAPTADAPAEPAPPVGERIDVVGGGIRYRSPNALLKLLERMKAAGHEPLQYADKGSIAAVTYRDPENVLVEVFAPVAGGAPKATEVIDRAAFVQRFS